jgi:hypothetical protein
MNLKEQKMFDIRKNLEDILDQLEVWSKSGSKLHEVEIQLFKRLLFFGKLLLQYYVYMVSELVKSKGTPIDNQGNKFKNTGNHIRNYRSIYGVLPISRPKYYSPKNKVLYILDAELGLPKNSYSYVLKDWLSYGATDLDFDQSAKLLERILGQPLAGMQSRRSTYDLSKEVDWFYAQKDWTEVADTEGDFLSLSIDGKGVPIVRRDRDGEYLSTAARLGKGRRKGIKKEATVSVSSSFTARSRDSEGIISALFKKDKIELPNSEVGDHKFHLQKHIRAFMADKTGGIEYGIDHLIKRDPEGKKQIVILVDGEPALRKQTLDMIESKGLSNRLAACILDFIHVLEKVWRVANAYKGEKEEGRQNWVEEQARMLLNSETEEVIREWKRIEGLKSYSKTQAKHIKDGINYFEKRIQMMDYKTFLANGYPITTGAVESACGHFVKSRMENSGMHWAKEGAQKMLDIRAVNKNGDWDKFINAFIDREQQQLYKSAA